MAKEKASKNRDSESFAAKLRESGWTLALFGVAVLLSAFFHAPRWEQKGFQGMLIHCLPTLTLHLFVYRHGLSSRDGYGHKILAGILFSSVGDAFLDFPGYFLHGALSFLVAHLFFISAFGFSPLKLGLGIGVFGVLSFPLMLVFDALMKLDTISSIVLPIYGFVLKTMVWRSIAKATEKSDGESDCGKIAGGIGGLVFAISDTMLALDRFYRAFPYSQKLTMATYYIAQLFIALSVLRKRPSAKEA